MGNGTIKSKKVTVAAVQMYCNRSREENIQAADRLGTSCGNVKQNASKFNGSCYYRSGDGNICKCMR